MRIETVGSMISVWETPLWGMSIEMAPGTDASRHPRQEVAHLAGVDAAYVDLLIDLEILKPDHLDLLSAGDVRRVRWIRSFERSGVPLEGISSAVRRGALSFAYLDMSAFDWFARLTSKTFEQSSVSSGIPFELLAVVRETFGHPEPDPTITSVKTSSQSSMQSRPSFPRDIAHPQSRGCSASMETAFGASSRRRRRLTGPKSRSRCSSQE
jgi:hypothetical protein